MSHNYNYFNYRRGRKIAARVPAEPGAGAQHRRTLLPDHIPRAVAPSRKNGHLNEGGQRAEGQETSRFVCFYEKIKIFKKNPEKIE